MLQRLFTLILLYSSLSSADNGSLLFYGNCTACHIEKGKKVAPHFSEIKGYYKLAHPKKEDFVTQMSQWISSPNKKNAKLQDAIKKFHLMPNLAIDKEILKEITAYLFECEEF